jgi:hypothetical protein
VGGRYQGDFIVTFGDVRLDVAVVLCVCVCVCVCARAPPRTLQ